jgi:hypothetical protein
MTVIALLFVAAAAVAQENAEDPAVRGIRRDIARIEHAGSEDAILSAMLVLAAEISSSRLAPDVKWSLLRDAGRAAFIAAGDPASLASCFLGQRDKAFHRLAFTWLLQQTGWAEHHPALRSQVDAMLDSDATPDDDRLALIWICFASDIFSDAQPAAMAFAADHANAERAHRAAQGIVANFEHDPDSMQLLRTSEIRAIREEETRTAYNCGDKSAVPE